MRHEIRKITVAAQGNNSAAVDIRDLRDVCVFVDGLHTDGTAADTFSVKVQAKVEDGESGTSNWVDLTGALAATTMVPLDRAATTDLGGFSLPWTHVRLVSTTIGTKPPRARIVGYNTRTN